MSDRDMAESQKAENNYRRYMRARDNGHTSYVTLSKKCNRYYAGDQWDEKDIETLKEQGRPWLTINEILPTINTVLGEQVRTRADVQYKPRANGLTEVAQALNKVYLQITDNNKLEWKESELFADGVIGGRGFYDVRMDFSDSIQGEVRISVEDPHDIVIDPDARNYDPKEWKEVFRTRWLSVEDVESNYGKEAADKLKYLYDDHRSFGNDSLQYEETFSGDDGPVESDAPSDDEDRKTVRRVRVVERQWRKLRRQKVFVDNMTGDMRPIPDDMDDERVKAMAQQYNMSVITRMVDAIRWTVSADRFILHDDWSPYSNFTIIPYFAYFRRGRPFGVVENLISPQDNLNKISSQELHVVNTTANSGWIYESGTLVDMTREELERDGSKTGLVLEKARGAESPEKIQPNQIPTGLDRIGMKAAQFVRDISGVSESMLGYDGAEVSGVAIERKQSRGLVQMQVVFDNLARTRQLLAERVLDLVQHYYTEERIIRITDNRLPQGQEQEDLIVNELTPEGIIVNDLTLGEYDVTVSSVPARDTYNDSQFSEALALRNVGVMIPDDTVIEFSNLTSKMDIADRVRNMQGLGEPSPEEQEMAAMVQQLQLQRTQLELQELEAKSQELMTRAELNKAKAYSEMQGEEGEDDDTRDDEIDLRRAELAADIEKAQAKLAADIKMKREELANKLRIAERDAEVKLEKIRSDNMNARLAAKEKESEKEQTGSSQRAGLRS